MGGWGGLLMKAAAGALAGDAQGREIAEERRRRAKTEKAQDLFTYLKLLDTPGVHIGEQPAEGTPLPKQPEGLPTSMRAVAKAPKSLIDVGSIALNGQEQPVGFDPDYRPEAIAAREKKQGEFERQSAADVKAAQQRQAFDMLHEEDPDAYPSFVDGFDYGKEVTAFLDDQRTAHAVELKAKHDDELKDDERNEKRAIQQAETRAFNMLTDGMQMPQVWADPQVREWLSRDDVIRLAREARQASAGVNKEQQVEDRLEELLAAGVPKTRARILANDPTMYRQWDKSRNGGVAELLGDDDEEVPAEASAAAPAPKRRGRWRIFGRDQGSDDDRIKALIEQNPNASDEEIAALLEGKK